MSKKSAKIAALIDGCRGQELNAYYLGYFACFNQRLYYEAHDVLEELWLSDKQSPNYSFYKGLIQLAGAFVHLQKNRLQPSAALFKLAQANLKKYPSEHEDLDLKIVLSLIGQWLHDLESNGFTINPLSETNIPKLSLLDRKRIMPSHLLIATRNVHKVAEIRAILSTSFEYLTLRDFPEAPVTIEDATTFSGNAMKKSVELAGWISKLPIELQPPMPWAVLADDSGLEVDALDGAPGVYSARFAGLGISRSGNSSDADNNAKLLRLLEKFTIEKRTGRFRCVLALTPSGSGDQIKSQTLLFDGTCEGHIALAPSGKDGFGYDPLFVPNGYRESFAELGEAIKNQLSHRAKALAKLRLALGVT